MSMISLRDVDLRFESEVETVTALDKVNLDVNSGEFVAVFGASGSGKTTLLNVLAGLIEADSGSIAIADYRVDELPESRRALMRLADVGVVFQDHNLIAEFDAAENIMLPLRARGWSAAEAKIQAQASLAQVGLEGLGRRMPAQLSGGQKQRVGIARALVGGRMVLLADEPTGALDNGNSIAVFELLLEFAQSGVSVVVASHDPLIRQYADRLITMQDGRIVSDSRPS